MRCLRLLPALTLVLLLPLAAACGGGPPNEPTFAQGVKSETDGVAAALLPDIVLSTGTSLDTMPAGFASCGGHNWRYQADGDLLVVQPTGIQPSQDSIVEAVTNAMDDQGLTVTVQDDGTVLGRRAALSVSVGPAEGPEGAMSQHVTFLNDCTGYFDADQDFAENTPELDYAGFVG
ncbi:hypothetical protein BH11ACT8_BH11ACT8_21470 [soil metagenome]